MQKKSYFHYKSLIKAWTYYKWTNIVSLMNSCTCLCQKYHNDILYMLPSFDLITTAASQPEKNQNSSLGNLQNACAEENKSLKLWKVYVQLCDMIEHYYVCIFNRQIYVVYKRDL